MKKEFKVTIAIPEGMSVSDMVDFIHDAITFMPGGYHPDDPRFSVDRDSVKVVRLYRNKIK